MEHAFTAAASLLAEPTRAVMLLELLHGRALAAGELAAAANVSPQTASGHLVKLLEAHLLTVESQGRHRYYRLAGAEVADALEAMLVLFPGGRKRREPEHLPDAGTLAYARTCYSHLAGWLGVRITDCLLAAGYLQAASSRRFFATKKGEAWFVALGLRTTSLSGRQCLDWTERRPHISGPLGIGFYRRLREMGWIVPLARTRAVRVTLEGKRELWSRLRVPLP